MDPDAVSEGPHCPVWVQTHRPHEGSCARLCVAGLGKRPHGSARVVDSIFVAKLRADVAKGKKTGGGKSTGSNLWFCTNCFGSVGNDRGREGREIICGQQGLRTLPGHQARRETDHAFWEEDSAERRHIA